MKIFLRLLIILALFPLWLSAQTTYSIGSIPYNPDPFATGTNTGLAQDDIWSGVVALPFSFCFADSTFDSILIGTNGIVTFDLTNANGYCSWPLGAPAPSQTYQNLSVMAPCQDLNPSFGGTIFYDVRGTAPYRRFIVSYNEVAMFSCTSTLFSEQVIFYETTNVIEVHIKDKPLCAAWNNGAAILGIQVDTATAYIVPGYNYPTQWTATHESWRFTPVGPCLGPSPVDSLYGQTYFDYNNNCVKDANEFASMGRVILANGGTFYDWTDANGLYDMGLTPGAYAVTEGPMPSNAFPSSCVPGGAYNVVLSGNVLTGLDFPDSVDAICADVMVDIGAVALRRCRTNALHVTYCNLGTYPDSNVVVTVVLNDSMQIDSSSMSYLNPSTNTYTFSIGNLMPGQCGNITLWVATGCDTAGTVYCMSASIAGTYATECDTTNNASTDCHALTAPLDPNEKFVAAQNNAQLGYVHSDTIDNNDVLKYMITFQNVGTAPAQDVVVRDTIDGMLDAASIQMGAASALYNWVVIGNVLIVRFENIELPDSNSNEPGSHGFVKFGIAQAPGNQPGEVIHNEAAIYFDFEAPVITNTTENIIRLATSVRPGMKDVVKVFPNPGHDRLVIERQVSQTVTFRLFDLTGKQLYSTPLSEVRTVINTEDLQSGLYLYRLESDGMMLEAGKWTKN
jgi:uncharacterized repeat protein (TIGR01451 family)